MSILKTENLKKYYGKEPDVVRALDGASLDIEDGEFVAVVGTSGSGQVDPSEYDGRPGCSLIGKGHHSGQRPARVMDDDRLTIFRRRRNRIRIPVTTI